MSYNNYDYSYFDEEFSKEDSVDEKIQIYRLIMSYAMNSSAIKEALKNNEDGLIDFVSYAYVHFMEIFYNKYDPNVSKLSTYVYTVMNYLYPIFINQVKYSLDFNTARKLINSFRPEVRDIMRKMYAERKTVDFCDSTIEIRTEDSSGDNDEVKYIDLNLADPNDYIEKLLDDYNDEDLYKQFDLILDRYIKSRNVRNGDRVKDIIKEYTFRNRDAEIGDKITLASIGEKYGLTRERIRQIVDKFYKWAKNDKELKACLDSDYIDRIINERNKKYRKKDF